MSAHFVRNLFRFNWIKSCLRSTTLYLIQIKLHKVTSLHIIGGGMWRELFVPFTSLNFKRMKRVREWSEGKQQRRTKACVLFNSIETNEACGVRVQLKRNKDTRTKGQGKDSWFQAFWPKLPFQALEEERMCGLF